MQQLKNHYENVVKEELMEYYGHEHAINIGQLRGITVGQSLRNRQFNVKHVPAAQRALYRRTGQIPSVVTSGKSVSGYRRIKGDIVGVKVHLTGDNMQGQRNHRRTIVLPQLRPFTGFTTNMVDKKGNVTFPIKQPMVFPVREKFYEVLLPLCSKQGLYVTRETSCKTREESISLLTARQVPLLGKQEVK